MKPRGWVTCWGISISLCSRMTWIITEEMSILQKKCILNCCELAVTKITPETKEPGNSWELTAWAQVGFICSCHPRYLTLLSALFQMEFANAPKAAEVRTHLLLFYFSKPGQFQGSLWVQPPPVDLQCRLIWWPTPCPYGDRLGLLPLTCKILLRSSFFKTQKLIPTRPTANDIW